MPISHAELASLTCPQCRTQFDAEIWTLLDTAERPDLAEQLLNSTLNIVTCPHCAHQEDAGGPLLVHDPGGRRVYFAAPDGAAEHLWREQAQTLLYVLVGSLPEEARQPYLGDVQVEVEAAGVRRAMQRRGRRFAARPATTPAPPPPVAAPPQPDTDSLIAAIEELLAADTPAEVAALAARRPELVDEQADALLDQLIATARAQGEPDVARALAEARLLLHDLRAGTPPDQSRIVTAPAEPSPAGAPATEDVVAPGVTYQLSAGAYQALLRADGPPALREAIHEYPALLEPWADDDLAARVDAALDDGNERLAHVIETRRDTLDQLRAELAGGDGLRQAIDALIRAGNAEDALAAAIGAYPALLTDAAQTALFELAAGARLRGDTTLAEYAIECRAMLRSVREGLQEE